MRGRDVDNIAPVFFVENINFKSQNTEGVADSRNL